MTENKSEPTSPRKGTSFKMDSPVKPNGKDSDSEHILTAATRRVLEEEPYAAKENKYTGCNCTKSQCLKMYCACFSVGRMCDQVLLYPYRPVFASPVRTTATIWSAQKSSTKSSPKTPTPSPANSQPTPTSTTATATAASPSASKNIATASGGASSADRAASATAATTRPRKKRKSRRRKKRRRSTHAKTLPSYSKRSDIFS